MQQELMIYAVFIMGCMHGYSSIPSINHDYEIKHDISFQIQDNNQHKVDQIVDKKSDTNLEAHDTVRSSIAVSALHIPYNQHIFSSVKRRHEIGQFTENEEAAEASEGFYPSFMRNSRQYFQAAENERFRPSTIGRAKFGEQSLLGSGDFGIIKGGTFYQDNDPPIKTFYNDFHGINLKSHNGHQRPYAAPLVQKIRYPSDSSDPFSNFRDFADINVSNDAGQYSEFYMVYKNRNDSQQNRDTNGANSKFIRNIKDKLDLIDAGINADPAMVKTSKVKEKSFQMKKKITKKSRTKIPINASTTVNSDSDSDFMIALS